jgi:hypothetical protein
MRAFLDKHGGRAETTRVGRNATRPGDVALAVRAARGGGVVELLTFPGVLWNTGAWDEAIGAADVLVVVLDARPEKREQNEAILHQLAEIPRAPSKGCIIVTKTDIVPVDLAAIRVAPAGGVVESWPRFSARSDSPQSLVTPLEALLGPAYGAAE